MRILEVTQTYSPFFEFGGPPTKVRALAEGLAALGNEVTVLTADWGLDKRLLTLPDQPPAENSPFGRRQKLNGVTAIYLGNWLHYRAISWNPALPRYLRARLQQRLRSTLPVSPAAAMPSASLAAMTVPKMLTPMVPPMLRVNCKVEVAAPI